MEKLTLVDWVAVALVVVGGLNWGLVGLLDFNLVTTIFGYASVLTKAVYALVAVSAIYLGVISTKLCKS